MTAITFDTLAYVKTLREAGVPEPQAEAQAGALAEALRQNMGEPATKTDLRELELATRADLRELELRLDARLEAMKGDLLKWVIGLFIAQVGLFAALVKLLH